jgi:hypothetical protein
VRRSSGMSLDSMNSTSYIHAYMIGTNVTYQRFIICVAVLLK